MRLESSVLKFVQESPGDRRVTGERSTQSGAARCGRPLRIAVPALALAFQALAASSTETEAGRQSDSNLAQSRGAGEILREALDDARRAKDPWYRAVSFVEISAASRDLDPATSAQALKEAIDSVPRLREGPGFLASALQVVAPLVGIFGGVSMFFPSAGALASASSYGAFKATRLALMLSSRTVQGGLDRYYTTVMRRITRKEQLTIQLLRLLASSDSARALELALLLEGEARALGISIVLAEWPSGPNAELAATVRRLAAGQGGADASPEVFAALAEGLAVYDAPGALDLAERAVTRLSPKADRWAAERVYAVLAKHDREATERALSRLEASGRGAKADLIEAFARGAVVAQPDLAWKAIGSLRDGDEEPVIRAALLREMRLAFLPTFARRREAKR